MLPWHSCLVLACVQAHKCRAFRWIVNKPLLAEQIFSLRNILFIIQAAVSHSLFENVSFFTLNAFFFADGTWRPFTWLASDHLDNPVIPRAALPSHLESWKSQVAQFKAANGNEVVFLMYPHKRISQKCNGKAFSVLRGQFKRRSSSVPGRTGKRNIFGTSIQKKKI